MSPYKDSDKESKQSANDIFYRSHVSGFSGIKKKYQAKEGLAMKKREEMKTQFVDPSYTQTFYKSQRPTAIENTPTPKKDERRVLLSSGSAVS